MWLTNQYRIFHVRIVNYYLQSLFIIFKGKALYILIIIICLIIIASASQVERTPGRVVGPLHSYTQEGWVDNNNMYKGCLEDEI